jgi:hypothetical protein
VVGSIGLFWPPDDGAIEIGYGIVASRRGRGYAAEATRALTAYALTAPGVDTVFATVELSNPASVSVAGARSRPGVGSHVDDHQVAGDATTKPRDSYSGRPSRDAVSVTGTSIRSAREPSITARPTPRERKADGVPTQ